MSCDVGKAREGLGNELWRRWRRLKAWRMSGAFPTSQDFHLRQLASRPWCGSFAMLSQTHSLFSIWTDLKRSERSQGYQRFDLAIGPSELHQNSPQYQRYPTEKHITFLSEKWPQHGVNNLWNVAGTVYFTLQKQQIWPSVAIDDPHTMKPEVGPMCRGRIYSGRWCSFSLPRTCARPSLAYRQNLLSSLKTTERHSTLQSTLSQQQSSRARRCPDVSGILTRGACDLSPDARKRFPKILVTQQVQHVPGFLPRMLFGETTAARTMRRTWRGRPEPGLRVRGNDVTPRP